MNRRSVSIRGLLCFILMMFLIISGCGGGASSSDGGGSETTAFAQSDLAATWDVHMLKAGSSSSWWRGTVTLGASGNLTASDCYENSVSVSCPAAGTIVWTINTSTGVITESGSGSNADNHYTMASDKNFIVGTQHSIGTTEPALLIAQKKGGSYAAGDIQGKTLVFHALRVGKDDTWIHGAGDTNGSGLLSRSWSDGLGGSAGYESSGKTLAVDTSGIVTMNGESTAQGFMSPDKKTVVMTFGDASQGYHLMIIQITNGQTGMSTSQVAGTSYGHELVVGASPAPFWAHETISATTGGSMSYSGWVCSNNLISAPTAETIAIGSTGNATISGTDFDGQASYDGTFLVGTQTPYTSIYSLMVITR
ncbi:MAG: hypothetical protein NTW65_09960 [Deltaproteobacteria bacterium]|nr:hypothetical protein [Deltaproteobacteria bacterium]